MTDFVRHVARTGETVLLGDHVGDLLLSWTRNFVAQRTTFIVVPDVTTVTETDGLHTVEADIVGIESHQRHGIRILISARRKDNGWTFVGTDVHAPTSVPEQIVEQALDQVLDDEAEHPLADLVAGIVENLSKNAFDEACDGSFRAFARCDMSDVDDIWIDADRSTMRGSADAWTIDVTLGVDTDCGRSDYALTVSGGLSLGVTRFDRIALAA